MLVCKYVDENGSAAMLVSKRSADVAPEVNLRENTSCMFLPSAIRLPTLALKPRTDVTRSPNRGISGPTKGHVSTKH